ncbi:hypothetical protein BaRGS_00007974 [Batillaria attramentaria]|uniref:Uncharacterized protein n=1 Tax=Batillaria attramentaria TaxID=370345 RepID=A0ABD0LNI2_9CAEN
MLFDMEENGLYSSLPFVGRLFSGLLAGYLSDLITRKEWFSVATTRKLFQGVGCIGCAVCMQAVGFLDHTWRGAAVVLLVLAISFQNLTSVAFRINHLDIAPRYAGVMIGMTVTAAVFFSLTGPPITAFIISRQTENLPREKSQDTTDSQADWLVVFIMAALNVFGALFFAAFAKGSVQSWAARQMSDEDIYRG